MPDDHDDPAPDLQELVRKYRGYHAITAQARRRWDRANTDWQTRRRLVRRVDQQSPTAPRPIALAAARLTELLATLR